VRLDGSAKFGRDGAGFAGRDLSEAIGGLAWETNREGHRLDDNGLVRAAVWGAGVFVWVYVYKVNTPRRTPCCPLAGEIWLCAWH
jgi:hypothetical protein